jgi:hypothetical protein
MSARLATCAAWTSLLVQQCRCVDRNRFSGVGSLPTVGSPVPLSGATLRRGLFVLVPILVLVADFISFPAAFESRPETTTINLTALLSRGRVPLGILRAHHLYVSVDDIASSSYLPQQAKGKNALIIRQSAPENSSHFAGGV